MAREDDKSLASKEVSTVNSENEEDIEISPDILEKLPEPARSHFRETFGLISGPLPHPLAKKITSEHIDKLIDNEADESRRAYDFKQNGRYFTFAYVVLAVTSFFALAWMFAKDDPELFSTIVSHFAAVVAGFAAGWGFTAIRSNSE